MAETAAAGGPTVHTRQTLPDWDGRYNRSAQDTNTQWIYGRINQTSTILSLLTPEYQQRMVQMNYHEAVNNAPQWNAAYCYPEGFMRWWAQFAIGQIEIMATPHQVQFLAGIADNFLRRVLIGRSHVQQVPQWYGETVGFWKGDVLDRLDRERPGVDAVALDVRVQQLPGDDRSLHAPQQRRRELRRAHGRDDVLRSRSVRRAAAQHDPLGSHGRTRSSDAAIHVHRVPEQHHERQRPPDSAHHRRPAATSTITAGHGRRTGTSWRRVGKSLSRRFPAYWAASKRHRETGPEESSNEEARGGGTRRRPVPRRVGDSRPCPTTPSPCTIRRRS